CTEFPAYFLDAYPSRAFIRDFSCFFRGNKAKFRDPTSALWPGPKRAFGSILSSTSSHFGSSSRSSKGVEQQAAEGLGEFCKGCPVSGECKNPLPPQPTPYGGDSVRERHVLLARPHDGAGPRVATGQLAVQGGDYRVQPEQTGRHPQHGLFLPAGRCLQAE